jgi:putative FmdB family regulatory protein
VPTYAYACTECDHRFEVVQSFTDDSLTVCPECGGRLRKVFNAVGIVFKGGGLYRNDSRAEPSASSGGAGAGDGGSSSSAGSGAGSPASDASSSSSAGSGSSSTSSKESGSSTGPSVPNSPSTAPA